MNSMNCGATLFRNNPIIQPSKANIARSRQFSDGIGLWTFRASTFKDAVNRRLGYARSTVRFTLKNDSNIFHSVI